jgi:hypothetical protein
MAKLTFSDKDEFAAFVPMLILAWASDPDTLQNPDAQQLYRIIGERLRAVLRLYYLQNPGFRIYLKRFETAPDVVITIKRPLEKPDDVEPGIIKKLLSKLIKKESITTDERHILAEAFMIELPDNVHVAERCAEKYLRNAECKEG